MTENELSDRLLALIEQAQRAREQRESVPMTAEQEAFARRVIAEGRQARQQVQQECEALIARYGVKEAARRAFYCQVLPKTFDLGDWHTWPTFDGFNGGSFAIVPQWVRCGKPGCKCSRGELHGPYYYRFWRENGRLRKQYVKQADAPFALALQAIHRRVRQASKAARRIVDEWGSELRAEIKRLSRARSGRLEARTPYQGQR